MNDPGSFWMPPSAAKGAELVDYVYFFIYWTSVVSFVVIIALMVWFGIKHRAKRKSELPPKQSSHNTLLEIGWSVPVFGVSVFLFYFGAIGYIDSKSPPRETYTIQVRAFKWGWAFTYPNGYVDNQLHVPADRPVKLVMGSDDIIHSLFIPAFRLKQDVVPGRYTTAWFEATEPGTYDIFCAEYCGTKHSEMLSKVVVQSPDAFDAWLEKASNFLETMPPAEAGAKLFAQRGCTQCHSVDGKPGIGPTMKGLMGLDRAFTDGTKVTADENYIRESILAPKAKLVAGYGPVMPTFAGKLSDPEIDAIIAYLRTLSSQGEN